MGAGGGEGGRLIKFAIASMGDGVGDYNMKVMGLLVISLMG